jgi:hypothetical protein
MTSLQRPWLNECYGATSMPKLDVAFYLEDFAHESFVPALVKRLAVDVECSINPIIRSATGGHGVVMGEFQKFVRDVKKRGAIMPPLLVVALDGNSVGRVGRVNQVREVVNDMEYRGRVVCIAPEPHIERWYLIDKETLQELLQSSTAIPLPPTNGRKDQFKQALAQAVVSAGVDAPFEGIEYGEELAERMNLVRAGSRADDFSMAVDDLMGELSAIRDGY